MLQENVRMQFISHFTEQYSYLDSIAMALEGGCRWVQLRMKDASDEEILPIALEVKNLCAEKNATFIIDDIEGIGEKLEEALRSIPGVDGIECVSTTSI